MNPDDGDALDNDQLAQLAAYDDQLARGDTPVEDEAASPAWPRLQACLKLLRQDQAAAEPRVGYRTALPERFGRFLIHRELGRGGFGIVFLATDPKLKRHVALKVPRPDGLANAALKQRFLREARAAARLDHPNVVAVHEVGEIGTVCYIVSAYYPGEDLAVWLARRSEPLPPTTAAELMATVADAVEHAHRHGVFHRDLKPSNILLTPTTEPGRTMEFVPRLTDFGLAKLLETDSHSTSSGVILGTPVYMAPEQAEGWSEQIGAPTDVYALGVILYELLTRRLPCQGASLLLTLEQVRSGRPVPPRRLQPGVPAALEAICLKCLEKEPGDRYASAAALADDLRRFLRDEPIVARPPGPAAHLRAWCRRPQRIHDASLVATCMGFMLIVGSLTGALLGLAGTLPVERWGPALVLFLCGIVVGGAILWNSRGTAAHRRRALWNGLWLPWVHTFYVLAMFWGWVDSGGLMNHNDPSSAMAQLTLLSMVSAIVFLAYVLALVAYAANRHRPGFAPPGR